MISKRQLSIKNLPSQLKPASVKVPPLPPSPSPATAFPNNAPPAVHLRRLLLSEEKIQSLLAEVYRKGTFTSPSSKDLPCADVSKKSRNAMAANDNLNAEQPRIRSKLLSELHRKHHLKFCKNVPSWCARLDFRTSRTTLLIVLRRPGYLKHSTLPECR